MNEPWKTAQWFTSCWNHIEELKAGRRLPRQVRFHDVTLRDGEQQAGIMVQLPQRLQIARMLAAAGMHRIETGMPAVSSEDAELLETLASENLGSQLMAFAHCAPDHIATARRLGADGVLLKITTSEHLLRAGGNRSVSWAIGAAIEAIAAAREVGLYSVLFTIDSTRTAVPDYVSFLEKICAGAPPDAIAVADSYGVATPEAIGAVVRLLRRQFMQPVEIHCHDDFGLATAATLAGVSAGAEVAHVTLCGLGERAGNASLEETATALCCLYGVDTGIKLDKLYELSQYMQRAASLQFPSNRAVVGEGLYRIQTDVVADLHRRCKDRAPLEYLPFLPGLVGRPGVEIALGKGCGAANVAEHLAARGLVWPDPDVESLAARVRKLATREQRLLTAEDFDRLLAEPAS